MSLPSRVLLWVAGLGYLGFGLAFLFDPLGVMAAVDIALQGPLAAIELRAFYGGLEVGLGVLLLAAAQSPRYLRAGLWLCLASYGAIGLARGLGMLLAQTTTPFFVFAIGTELVLAALALWRLRADPVLP